jgi:CxxC-x17-CxxC domain-containing protein
MYQDKVLICQECGKEFIWTAGEQEFYAEKGFTNVPKRCPECRAARKNRDKPQRQMYDAICANCGKPCKVPFKPTEGRPVYCSECFAKMREQTSV